MAILFCLMYVRDQMRKDQLKATNEVIEKLKGLTQAAAVFDCSVSNVQKWRIRGVPTKYLKKVVELTGVKRERLRPDLYE